MHRYRNVNAPSGNRSSARCHLMDGQVWVQDDLSDYTSARWPKVVRAVMLLGCEAHEAEDLAQATLTAPT